MQKLKIPAPKLTQAELAIVNKAAEALKQETESLQKALQGVERHIRRLQEVQTQLDEAKDAAIQSLSPEVHGKVQQLLSVVARAQSFVEEAEGAIHPAYLEIAEAINEANRVLSKITFDYLLTEVEKRARAAFALFFRDSGRLIQAVKDSDARDGVRLFVNPYMSIAFGWKHLLELANSRATALQKLATGAEDLFEFEGCDAA